MHSHWHFFSFEKVDITNIQGTFVDIHISSSHCTNHTVNGVTVFQWNYFYLKAYSCITNIWNKKIQNKIWTFLARFLTFYLIEFPIKVPSDYYPKTKIYLRDLKHALRCVSYYRIIFSSLLQFISNFKVEKETNFHDYRSREIPRFALH